MGINLSDPISTPKAYERWLKVMLGLSVVFGIVTVVSLYKMFTGSGDSAVTVLAALVAIMFFLGYREKSNAPRPGSPEYIAIKRQEEAKVQAAKDRRYRKKHPHQLARELIDNNKVSGRISFEDVQKRNNN